MSSFVENSGTIGEVNTSEQILNPAPQLDDSSVFVVDDYADYKGHEVMLGLGTWTSATTSTIITNDLFRNFMDVAGTKQLGRKLRSFKYVRGNLRATIVVQGASNAYGKRVISFDPVPMGRGYSKNVTFPAVGETRCFLVPHIEIDPSKSATYYVDLPPPTIYGVYSMASGGTPYHDQLGSYRVTSTIINPLCSGTSATPSVSMVMYLSLVGAKIGAPTTNTRFNWTALEEEQKAEDGGVVSGLLTKAAGIAGTIAKVAPGIAQPLTLFSAMSESTAKFLTWFGFSKPIVQDVQYIIPGAGHNYTKVDNKIRVEQLAMRSNNSLSITGHDIPLFNAKEMETEWLCAKKGLIGIFPVAPADSRDKLVFDLPVTPCDTQLVHGVDADEAELTPLAFAALPYQHWRGDLVFTIEVVASVFSRCTLFVAWDPVRVSGVPNVADLSQVLKHWVIEVSGSTTTEIRIPWKQLAHFANRYWPRYGASHAEPTQDESNGQLICMVMNPLVQNGSTDPIFVNVYVHGENMKFGWVSIEERGNEWNGYNYMMPVNVSGSIFTSQVSEESNFFGKFFGEEHAHTVKELASRMTTYDSPLTSTDGDISFVRRFAPYECPPAPGLPVSPTTLLQFLSLAYVGMRGSLNVSTWCADIPFGTIIYDLVWSSDESSNTTTTPGQFWTGVTTQSLQTNSIATVSVPYYYNGLFKPSYNYYASEDACFNMWTPSGGKFFTAVGLGDDGVFVGFRGVPRCKFALPA